MRYAYIDVKSEFSLEDTAQKLGAALCLDFEEEISGKYEEYPAYIAMSEEFVFALLGFPEPEYDLRDEKGNSCYQLQIMPRGVNLPSAGELATVINSAGTLSCRVCHG